MAAALALAAMLAWAPTASADLPQLLATCAERDAEDGEVVSDNALPYYFCDDGVPAFGGRNPNPAGLQGIEVPSAYTGAAGLPAKDASAVVPGEDADGDITIDADLSLPDPAKFPVPGAGYPLVVMMHGCCSGNKTSWEGATIDPGGKENWHYNNAWFASRGYAVLTYTSRGFVDDQNRGSTGETQLDSDRFEINDYQHMAGQLADTGDLNPGTPDVDETIELLDPGFLTHLDTLVLGHGLCPDQITIEITEHVLVFDERLALATLEAARERGYRVAIDDFGTGYSSLAYLRSLPIDTIKIPKTFIDGVGGSTKDDMFARAVIDFGSKLDLTVVAEGVERAEQVAILRSLGCDLAQGFYFAEPAAAPPAALASLAAA
ncbi:MAG TPA: EAL domain-containing protein [Thermoleophilaceae bacterium]|nr:EAL domain-containing protein [Thermoleophilaceae bacterium]